MCVPCKVDSDCSTGNVCSDGRCDVVLVADGSLAPDFDSGCATSAECSIEEMCNTSTGACNVLPSGWCRRAIDCDSGSRCSAANESVPGLCVDCLTDADCGDGERCGAGGSCAGDAASCPPNAALVGDTCECNAGFHLDAVTHLCESDVASVGCVENAHAVPGQPGACACNAGFEPSGDGSACVVPTSGGGNPPPGGGSNGSGDIIGNCGPNTIAIFFVCFCLPGFAPNPNGDVGCSEEEAQEESAPTPSPSGDVCADNGWYGDGVCDQFCASPDSDCNESSPPVSDVCEINGWYSDRVCDTICTLPDPDCSDECVANGWYGDGVCDTSCLLADPDC